jgi:Gas vesicle synthesis protein GvpL/GvpF
LIVVDRVSEGSASAPCVTAGMKKRSATYVYCVVAAPTRPRLTQVPAGLPGTGPVRLLDVEPGRYLVVADAPLSRYGAAAIRRGLSDLTWVSRAAVAHEAMVEAFIDTTAVLPMKLFTLFASDDRALVHLRTERGRVESLVKRLANHHEWGVRVVLDDRASALPRSVSRAKRAPLSGLAYLTGKKTQRDAARERGKHARAIVAGLYDRLAGRSRAARHRSAGDQQVQSGPLLLDAAFLVPRPRSRAFRALVAREARLLASQGYELIFTGPWPPYSFVQDE